MAVVVDDDTVQAVIAAWKKNAALSKLTAFLPQRPRLKAPQVPPYATITSMLDHREPASSRGAWFDFRRVEIIVRGVYGDVVDVLAAARDVFKQDMALNNPLVYPSGDRFMGWIPDKDTTMEIDEDAKAGDDIWKGTLSAAVESVRML